MGWFCDCKSKPEIPPVPHDCKIHGHKYEPRTEKVFGELASRLMRAPDAYDLECLKEKRYIKDICRYCGDCIKRDEIRKVS